MRDDILTIKGTVENLGVTERSVYLLDPQRKMAALDGGGLRRFERADIDSWREDQKSSTERLDGVGEEG